MSEWEPTNTNSVNLKPPRFMQKYFDQRFHMPIKLQKIAFNSLRKEMHLILFYFVVVLMGKNTMMRKAIRAHLDKNPDLEK